MMNVELAGDPGGPAILMLHGFLSSNAQWDLNRDALGVRHWLIQAELVGHGKSAAPDVADSYGLESVLDQIEAIRIAHEVDTWWLCGQSLGGAVLIHYALTHPECVKGIVFTNTRAAFGLGRKETAHSTKPRRAAPPTIRDLAVHPVHATRIPSPLHEKMIEAADAIPMHVVDHVTTHRDVWRSVDRMSELSMPVLLVNGRWEKRFQPCVDQARHSIAHLDVVDLEGGHAINIDAADEYNNAVIDFIAKH